MIGLSKVNELDGQFAIGHDIGWFEIQMSYFVLRQIP